MRGTYPKRHRLKAHEGKSPIDMRTLLMKQYPKGHYVLLHIPPFHMCWPTHKASTPNTPTS